MTRFKAAGIHLILSTIIASGVLGLMWFVWYPNGYFSLLDAERLIYIMTTIDVTLGPLLTFVIYKAGKKGLKFDISVIALLQIAALIYGLTIILKSRPVFNVFEKDLFVVTLASDFKDIKELQKAKNLSWRTLSWTGPIVVAAVPPTDPKARLEVFNKSISGTDWHMQPELYVEYDATQRNIVLKRAKPLASIAALSEANQKIIADFLNTQNKPVTAFVQIPVVYDYKARVGVLDAKNGDFIKILEIDAK